MTDESREELISAYLDGELTADERARVETWLAESAELRQLHDELRALQGSMRSLARHKLDHDLSSAVLRRAEQAVLRGSESNPVAGSIAPVRAAASWWNLGGGWRRVAWPAAAIAAALLIMVFNARETGVEREVARAPEQQKAASELKDLSAADGAAMPQVRARVESHEADNLEAAPLSRRRADYDVDSKQMRQSAAKPAAARPLEAASGAVAPKNEPAAEEMLEKLSAKAGKTELPRGLALRVSKEHFEDKSIEKLLDAEKIKWKPAPKVQAGGVTRFGRRIENSDGYNLEIPADRVDEVFRDLLKKARQAGLVRDEPTKENTFRDKALSDDEARREFTIWLMAPAAPVSAAAPASPAPADKP